MYVVYSTNVNLFIIEKLKRPYILLYQFRQEVIYLGRIPFFVSSNYNSVIGKVQRPHETDEILDSWLTRERYASKNFARYRANAPHDHEALIKETERTSCVIDFFSLDVIFRFKWS